MNRCIFLVVVRLTFCPLSVEESCRSRSLTQNDVERHFRTKSNLFFLFGIEIHRPFLNENEAMDADASLFLVAVCKPNSTDCFPRRASLPSDYQLNFSVGNQNFSNDFHQIDRQWHRTKKVNEDFLFRPINDHGWYDDPHGQDGSIWKTWIMNLNEFGNESFYSKWVEFDIFFQDAGIQIIRGEQIYRGEIVQQFEFHFFVSTFRCLEAPSIFFDDFLSTQTYLSSFHFRFHSDRCFIDEYSCELKRTKRKFFNSTSIETIFVDRQFVNFTVDHPSDSIEPLTNEHLTKGTSLNDHISEKIFFGTNFLRLDDDFSLQTTCSSIDRKTQRKFVLCAEKTTKNDSLNSTDRIDVVLCQHSSTSRDQCFYSLYDYQFSDRSLLFLPVKSRNISFVGFLRLPIFSASNRWISLVDENYPKVFARQLEKSGEHFFPIGSIFDWSSKIFFYSFRILTDANRVCQFVCEKNCTQNELDDDEFFFETFFADLIFFCPNCDWNSMSELRENVHVTSFSRLTDDLTRFRIFAFSRSQTMKFFCHQNQKTSQQSIRFYRYEPSDAPMCSIESNFVQPFHSEIQLECQNFFTRTEIFLSAITQLDGEQVKIWLNPKFLSTKKISSSKRIFQIDGIPHGKSVKIEVRSVMFSVREQYSVQMTEFTEQTIAAIRIAPDGNFFASAFRLIDEYFKVLKSDPMEFKKTRFTSIGLTQSAFLTNLIDYYRLIFDYIERESLHLKTKEFAEEIYSTISNQLLQNDLFYLESNLIYRDHFLSLLIVLSSKPSLITYDTFHLLRHTLKLIASSLPDLPAEMLVKLLKFCVQLRLFVLHPHSMPISAMINSRSLFELNQMINEVLVSLHRRTPVELLNDGPIDFLVRRSSSPLTSDRWALKFDDFQPIGIIYSSQEFLPLPNEFVDYQIGQIFSIESSSRNSSNFNSKISFSLRQNYLNVSKISQKYFYKIVLNRISTNFYSHKFSFELTSSSRVRNLSLVFIDLPNAEKYFLTTNIFYNDSCRQSIFSEEKPVEIDLSTQNFFVYSIPVESSSFVCGQIEIAGQDVEIRQTKLSAHFLVLESGCFSFSTTIFDDFYKKLENDRCQLIDEPSESLNSPHLTCVCHSAVSKFLLISQPKSIRIQFELNATTWFYFYIYLVVLLFVFLVLGFYAIYNETLDNFKPKIHFVDDNQIAATTCFSYQLTIFTGLQQRSSKNFQINVRLIGANGHDVVHRLTSKNFDVFQSGGVDRFFLTTFVDLGQIIALNIWQNDLETKSDLYLRHCILNDLKRHRTFYFCCYAWLSKRKRINTINELFYVAQQVDQYAFVHLFLSTYVWLVHHYHLFRSIFHKQRLNNLSRNFRLHFAFFLVVFQLFLIQTILSSCRNASKIEKCFDVLPSFSLLFDQSVVDVGWSTIYEIIRKNFFASFVVGLVLSFLTALLISPFIAFSTFLADRLEYFREIRHAETNGKSLENFGEFLKILSSSLVDFHQYEQDKNQFEFLHKFDLQHRISVSTFGENSTNVSTTNSNAVSSRSSTPIVFKPFFSPRENSTNDDFSTLSNFSSAGSTVTKVSSRSPSKTIKYKINWPKFGKVPSKMFFRFFSVVYFGIFFVFIFISIVCLFFIMKTFVQVENFSLTSETIFIHFLTIVLTPMCELLVIVVVCLLNAVFFHRTDENFFVSPVVEIPLSSENVLERPSLDHSFVLHRNLNATDEQLRERIRQRFLESSLIRAVRDVIGYVLFLIIIVFVVKQTAKNVETRLAMRNYAVQLFLRENRFHNIDDLPDTMFWIRDVVDKRLFLAHQHFSCANEFCRFAQIPDSPFYLIKSVRIRQIRLERKFCSSSTCFAGLKNLFDSPSIVVKENRKCENVCNFTSICSALASKKRRKFYSTRPSPWFYQMNLSANETVSRCDRKRKFYDLTKYRWFDEKTSVITIEANLYSPAVAAIISFVFTIEKNSFGTIDKEIFIETLPSENSTSERKFAVTHFLFALLLLVIFVTKMFDVAKFLRNFGFFGFIYFLRTLANLLDGILLVFCCFYFVLFYFDRKVFQDENVRQLSKVDELFVSFRVLIVNNAVLNHLIGFICFVAILKFLNLLKFNPKTFLLAETISRSANGFVIILFLTFVNYFIFTLIARLFFSNENSFQTFNDAFRLVLTSSIKDASSIDEFTPQTFTRQLWQIFLWLFSAKIIEYFLVSFVMEKFSRIRKTHRLTDEERIVGRIFVTFRNYFADQ